MKTKLLLLYIAGLLAVCPMGGNFDGNNTGSYRISSSQQFGTSGYFQEYFWSEDRYGYII